MVRIVLSFFLISAAVNAATYSVAVVPVPSGFSQTTMNGINNSGQVAGFGPSGGGSFAFLGNPQGSTPIPLPAGWSYVFSNAVNASGQVVGWGSNGVFIGSPSGSAAIPLPSGWPANTGNPNAYGVNASGQVAGFGNPFQTGTLGFIGTTAGTSFIALPLGATEIIVNALNNSGQAAGWANFNSPGSQAFIGTTTSSTTIPRPAGWLNALGYAVNDSGQVAGYGLTSSVGGPTQAFIGTTAGSTAIPLPFGATIATATWNSLNNSGQVVGSSDAGAWIWDAVNGTRLLNTLVPAAWKLDGAFGISNNGLILASASYNDGPDQYVELTPVTPTSGCTFEIPQPSAYLSANAAGGAINVQTSDGCTWNATSNSPWLTLSYNSGSGQAGSGSGAAPFQMSANPGSSTRVGVLTIAGFTIPVSQAAASVVTTLEPTGVTPAALSGAAQTFTFSFTDQAGAADLSVLDVLINNYLDGQQACYFAIVPAGGASGYLYLVDDAGDGGYVNGSPMPLPSSGVLQNSQCSISGAGGSLFTAGNNMTVSLNITFKPGFAGNKVIYMAARSNTQNSGWQALGTWNVPGPAPVGPAVDAMQPGRSTTTGGTYLLNNNYSSDGTYTFTFTDTNGYGDLAVVDILVNDFLDGIGACYVAYVPTSATTGYLYLVDDAGDGGYVSGSPLAIPSTNVNLTNRQCTIYGAGSSASASGNSLILNLRISFIPNFGFTGNRIFYLAARNNSTGNSGWQAVGSVTVP
jgi:hypothetical protein